ncbi:hypothetical protein ACFQ49_15310 [Kroppenstedtia eburnea]|uniref:hypothetical protein n=1 Tax=Kroppenstedtia eburnea TaxID=714067 RepID=UPI0002E69AB1
MEEVKGMLQSLLEGQQMIAARLDRVEKRLDGVESLLDRLEANQEGMEKRLSAQIRDIDISVDFVAGELGQHKKDIQLLKAKVE